MTKKPTKRTALHRDLARAKKPRLPGTYFDDEALRIAEVVDRNKDLSNFNEIALRVVNTVEDVAKRYGLDELTELAVYQLSIHHYLLGLIAAASGKPFEKLRPEDVIAVAVKSHLPKAAIEAPKKK